MTPTKARAVDAAVELLSAQGLRALTHARVDQRAGLPKGSTSNYFRTRKALVAGVAGRILELERAEVGAAFSQPSSPAEFVDGLCRLFDFLSGTRRTQTTARLVLFMEASHDADLRATLSAARRGMVGSAVVAMASLGAKDPAVAAAGVAACFEGLLLHRIARHDDTDPRPVLELVVPGARWPDARPGDQGRPGTNSAGLGLRAGRTDGRAEQEGPGLRAGDSEPLAAGRRVTAGRRCAPPSRRR
ncbi:TetR/AcrR family transcriptional regulator [Georgenia sp. SUBG003]|uniref:TetR/AcrR family transcriptional regulator n=1 Tax=Georgenia sp. SUBG003 TaxID=1497974 RepID=UPI003AB21488